MLIVGIAGGTGSGKTTVVKKVMSSFKRGEVALLPQDSYYKDNSHLPPEERQKLNFDHPDSIEWQLLIDHLNDLRHGRLIHQPVYSYLTCTRSPETKLIEPRKVVIVEGILLLTQKEVRDLLDIKVFVDIGTHGRILRRLLRDIERTGQKPADILRYFAKV